MSPKKAHEVSRMTEYISHLLSSLDSRYKDQIQFAVDVGAGQVCLLRIQFMMCIALYSHLQLILYDLPQFIVGSDSLYHRVT